MAPTKRPDALDEIVDQRQDVIDWWMQTQGGPHMDENMIHRYFYESRFFDHSTKNGLFMSQAASNFAQWEISNNRKAFEDNLRQRPGLEYMIVGEPQLVADKALAAQGVKTGIYVIRKQDRQRAQTNASQRNPAPGVLFEGVWEVTTLATYFIAGINVYQAPSVFDAVANRLLSAASSLNKVVDIANGLPRYTPSIGYHYFPQSTKRVNAAGSANASPSRSREGSVAPAGDSRSGSALPDAKLPASATTLNMHEVQLMRQSLYLALQHGDEYTDENPLSGEPGNFKFASSTAAVKKRRAEEAAAARARAEKESSSTSRAASPAKAPTPPAVFTEAKMTTKIEKSKTSAKVKRRKSKVNGSTNPSTPVSSTSAHAPNSGMR